MNNKNEIPAHEFIWFDAPEIMAEFLARTGLIKPALTTIARLAVATPLALARWLGSELRTTSNSSAPDVTPGESGAFSGIVFVHRNDAKAWALFRVGDAPVGSRYSGHEDPRLSTRRRRWGSNGATDLPESADEQDRLWGDDRWGGGP